MRLASVQVFCCHQACCAKFGGFLRFVCGIYVGCCNGSGGLQVIVRDIVSKSIVAQFRAHSSPLSALSFDPSGTLLVTASVYGHNLNVFRLTPPSSVTGVNTACGDANTSYVHLYKLSRGVTNAVSGVCDFLVFASVHLGGTIIKV